MWSYYFQEDSGTLGSAKPPLKVRPGKARSASSALRQQAALVHSTPETSSNAPATMTVVQTPTHWNQHQQNIMVTITTVHIFFLNPFSKTNTLHYTYTISLFWTVAAEDRKWWFFGPNCDFRGTASFSKLTTAASLSRSHKCHYVAVRPITSYVHVNVWSQNPKYWSENAPEQI